MADWDVVGTAPAQVQNPWAVRSMAPAPDATNPAVSTKETTEGPAGFANGLAELVGKGLGNMPLAAVHGLVDLVSRASGHGARPESKPTFPLSPNAQSVGQGISDTLGEAAAPYQNPAVTAAAGSEFARNYVAPVAGDVAAVAPVVGAAAGVGGLIGDARTAAAAATEAPAAVTKYGMQTGENNPIARNVAGASARPAVTAHNQSIADPVLGAQAGVPPGTKLSPKALEAAREAPNSVYQRAETSIPTGPLSPNSTQMVQNIGSDDMIVHSPDVQSQIDAQKARLLSGNLTGSEVVNGQRALRFNGFRNVGSEDPEQMALGQAQLKMADALHQHMVDTLPPNAPVSADQLSAARVALAQNHTIENALGPNGNVNLTKLAKLHNDNPGMLSGPMQEIAQFASDHPEVTRLPSDAERFNPSGVAKDVAAVDLKSPSTYLQPFFGAAARRTLTGAKPTLNPTVTGLGGEFDPLTPSAPEAPSAPPTAPRGPIGGGNQRGSFSLRDIEVPGNGNETSGGASVEAINRGTRNLVHWNGDTATPVSRDVNQIDRTTPPKGSIAIDADTGQLVSSGNTPRGLVQGLLARWKAHKPLGAEF